MDRFVQGQLNVLQWVMVDATDAFTPESALSAAMNIKVYGTLIGNSNVFFVTSGVGSLATSNRDVVHVGASATGIYAVPFGPAQLSDASNVFYDKYVVHISATGAARQTLLISGVRATVSDVLSTMGSQFAVVSNYLSQMSALLSDVDSALTSQFTNQSNFLSNISDIVSNAYSAAAQANSRILLTQSMASVAAAAASNANSLLIVGVPATITASDMSDIASRVWSAKYTAHSVASSFGSLFSDVFSRVALTQTAATAGASRALLVQSTVSTIFGLASDIDSALSSQFVYLSNAVSDLESNVRSMLAVMSGVLSDTYSGVSNINSILVAGVPVTLTASDLSNIGSAVWGQHFAAHQGASTFGSFLTEATTASDLASQIWAHPTASDLISKVSDLRSKVIVMSDVLSDIGSTMGSQFLVVSNYLSNISAMVSDIDSALTSQFTYTSLILSDLNSRMDSTVPSRSQLSDLLSDLRSLVTTTGVSLTSDTMSNIRSAITAAGGGAGATPSALWAYGYSNLTSASSIGSALRARLSTVSSIYSGISNLQSRIDSTVASRSQLSDLQSDLKSYLAGLSDQISDLNSDLRSLITNASWMSDLASHVWTAKYTALNGLSSFGSAMRLNMSRLSDTYSLLSDLQSDFQSRVPKAVATNSQLSDLSSDLRSYLAGLSDQISDLNSDLRSLITTTGVGLNTATTSDLKSAITAAGGGTGATASEVWAYATASDLISKVSDLRSKVIVMSDVLSDFYSTVNSQFVYTSAVLSDLNSRVDSTVPSRSQLSDLVSDLRSLVTITGVSLTSDTMSNLRSAIAAAAGGAGATPSALWAYGYGNLTAASSIGSALRTRLSTVSALYSGMSNLQSRVESTVASRSQLSDLASDLRSLLLGISDLISNVDSALTSQFTYVSNALSDLQSDLRSHLATRSQLSDLASDLKSAVAAGGLTSDTMSDIAVAVWNEHYAGHVGASTVGSLVARGMSAASDAASAAQQANSRALVAQSRISDIYELMSDVDSALTSQFTYESAALSDLTSRITGPMLTRAQTMSEVSVGAPPANPTQEMALMMMYQGIRNQFKTTTTEKQWFNDAGSVVFKKTIGAGSGSYVEQEAVAP
jgi:hypothetical protein